MKEVGGGRLGVLAEVRKLRRCVGFLSEMQES